MTRGTRTGIIKVAAVVMLITIAMGLVFKNELSASYQHPAVLVISVCSLRADVLEGIGGPVPQQLALLEKSGVRFDQAFTTSTRTAAALASLLSGEMPAGHRVFRWGDRLPPEQDRLVRLARQRGVPCAAFTGRNAARSLGVDGDFDTCRTDSLTDAEIGRQFIGWMGAAVPRGEPFVAWLHFGGMNEAYGETIREAVHDQPAVRLARQLTAAQRRKLRDDYRAAVERFDYRLGQVLVALRERGYREDNLVLVVVGDHGETLDEPGAGYWYGHRETFRTETVRVPLLWVGPRRRGGTVVRRPISTLDLIPTLEAELGAELGEPHPGANLFVPAAERVVPVATAWKDGQWQGIIVKEWFYRRIGTGPAEALPLVGRPAAPPLNREAVELRLARAFPEGAGLAALPVLDRSAFRALGYLQ